MGGAGDLPAPPRRFGRVFAILQLAVQLEPAPLARRQRLTFERPRRLPLLVERRRRVEPFELGELIRRRANGRRRLHAFETTGLTRCLPHHCPESISPTRTLPIAAISPASSAWRPVAVFAKMRRRCVLMVLGERLRDCAVSRIVLPDDAASATRASASVR